MPPEIAFGILKNRYVRFYVGPVYVVVTRLQIRKFIPDLML